MLDLEKLNKELKDTQELNKKLTLENQELHRQNIGVLEEIGKHKRLLSDAKNVSQKALDEKNTLLSDVKELKQKKADALSDIAKAKMEIEAKFAELDDKAQITADDAEKLKQREAKLKTDRVQLTSDEQALSRKQFLHDQAVAELAKSKENLEKERKEFEDEKRSTELKNDELNGAVSRANAVKKQYEEKLKDAEQKISELNSAKSDFEVKSQESEALKKDLEEKIAEAETVKKEADAAKNSFIRQAQALDVRENELNIRDLRIQKIIKEKGIAEELKALEASLK